MSIENPQIIQENCVRVGWKQAIERAVAENGREVLDYEWLDLPLASAEVFE